jgi:spore maturation protein SpmB
MVWFAIRALDAVKSVAGVVVGGHGGQSHAVRVLPVLIAMMVNALRSSGAFQFQ